VGDVKRMDVRQFREFGYLQELNRQFLHPLGLALEVVVERCKCADGTIEEGPSGATYTVTCPNCLGTQRVERLGGVWDYRDDPEGIIYSDPPDAAKAERVAQTLAARDPARREKLGYVVQPVPGVTA
jgi:hypothetical protein